VFNLPNNLSELIQFDPGTLSVISRESKHREFKQDFIQNDLSEYTKTLAAFANAGGGSIIFGVSDKPRQIIGIAATPDEAHWADRLREEFDPEILIATHSYVVNGRTLFAVGVERAQHRPIICKKTRSKRVIKRGDQKDVEVIREGSIYYRYAGQTRTISFPELTALLSEREQQSMNALLKTLTIIKNVGVEKAGIVKMSEGQSSIFMTPETAKGLSLIDKGRLVEDHGAPAYVVMGNVDIQKVIHAPLDEADKNLPSETAKQLQPLVRKTYGDGTPISPSQVSKILKHLKIDGDQTYCIHEKKFGRKFITRAGIAAIKDFIETKPVEALNTFGSRASIARYGQKIGGQ
jgi:hypothetical protein